jgi:hypothetical protein
MQEQLGAKRYFQHLINGWQMAAPTATSMNLPSEKTACANAFPVAWSKMPFSTPDYFLINSSGESIFEVMVWPAK